MASEKVINKWKPLQIVTQSPIKVDPLNALLCIFTSFYYQYPSILCCGIHNENYEQSLGPWRLQKNLKWSQMNYSNLGGQARLMYIGCTQPLFWSGLNWTSLTHQMFCYLCKCINIISTSRMPTSCTKCRDNRKVVNQMRPHKWLINCTYWYAENERFLESWEFTRSIWRQHKLSLAVLACSHWQES